ncbi:MAG: 2-dehydro-3-deoxyglucarate aldolase [Bacteroides sp. SM1_62]|nr:MAG: 2-dehydro-3-deoxyglucarate aldolase [Bacteroides sp. SM1_62]
MNKLKEKLSAGEAVHGCWLNSGSAINAEIVGKAGFDWVVIDLEHGIGTENNLVNQLQALSGSETIRIVRVEALVRQRVSRVLELGADGVLFPQIQNAREAEQAISFMRYPPDGKRGMASMVRATDFSQNFKKYYDGYRENVLGIIQIETLESLNHLDDIANIDGVDVLFVGPADMSLALGIFQQWDHPRYIETLERVRDAATKAGKATGTLLRNKGEYEKYYKLGYRLIGCGSDSVFVFQGALNMARELNDRHAKIK